MLVSDRIDAIIGTLGDRIDEVLDPFEAALTLLVIPGAPPDNSGDPR